MLVVTKILFLNYIDEYLTYRGCFFFSSEKREKEGDDMNATF